MRIGGDGMLASLALSDEPLCKKGFTEWREVGVGFHGVTPFHRASSRSLAAVISSGVLVRYWSDTNMCWSRFHDLDRSRALASAGPPALRCGTNPAASPLRIGVESHAG